MGLFITKDHLSFGSASDSHHSSSTCAAGAINHVLRCLVTLRVPIIAWASYSGHAQQLSNFARTIVVFIWSSEMCVDSSV